MWRSNRSHTWDILWIHKPSASLQTTDAQRKSIKQRQNLSKHTCLDPPPSSLVYLSTQVPLSTSTKGHITQRFTSTSPTIHHTQLCLCKPSPASKSYQTKVRSRSQRNPWTTCSAFWGRRSTRLASMFSCLTNMDVLPEAYHPSTIPCRDWLIAVHLMSVHSMDRMIYFHFYEPCMHKQLLELMR